MGWLKISDEFITHPKVLRCSPQAVVLWFEALTYSSRHLTDGVIEAHVLPLFRYHKAAKELRAAGLWDVVDGGDRIHDYHDHYEDAATVRERRRVDAERKRREQGRRSPEGIPAESNGNPGGIPAESRRLARARSDSDSDSDSETDSKSTKTKTPSPPTPAESGTRLRHVNGTGPHLAGFEDFWAAYPKKRAKLDAERAWTKLAPDAALQAEILDGVRTQAHTEDWLKQGGQFIPNPATFLNGRRWTDRPPEVPHLKSTVLRAALATADFAPPEDDEVRRPC